MVTSNKSNLNANSLYIQHSANIAVINFALNGTTSAGCDKWEEE